MIKTVDGKDFDNSKIYYKVTNQEENHHGLQFHDGLNEDIIPFNYEEECIPGGIYFTDIKDIFNFIEYGCYIREITVPDDALVFQEDYKYKASKLIFGKRMDIDNLDTIKYLIANGADSVSALISTVRNGYLDIVKYLIENGTYIHEVDDEALRYAAEKGHLDVVKYLVENGADIHAFDDSVFRYAACNGHLDVVKYLVENGADIHANDDAALRWAAEEGHINVIKYLVKKGADIHACDDGALKSAAYYEYLDIVEYLKSLK